MLILGSLCLSVLCIQREAKKNKSFTKVALSKCGHWGQSCKQIAALSSAIQHVIFRIRAVIKIIKWN